MKFTDINALRSEWVSERTNERSEGRERSERRGASEWVRCGSNDSVLYALISQFVEISCRDKSRFAGDRIGVIRVFVRLHRSPIHLLHTARIIRALRCAHSFVRSLTHSLQRSWERGFYFWIECFNIERVKVDWYLSNQTVCDWTRPASSKR